MTTNGAAHAFGAEAEVEWVAKSRLPSTYASVDLDVHAFRNVRDGTEHLALVKGPVRNPSLVRVHSECLTGDALGSLRCDCGAQLQRSLKLISESESGVVVYLRGHEGRGIGLANKIRAYALQDEGYDTVDANTALGFVVDGRDFSAAAQILKQLGVRQLRLLSNNPRKAASLERHGLVIVEQLPLEVGRNRHNEHYLDTKRDRLDHRLAPAGKATA